MEQKNAQKHISFAQFCVLEIFAGIQHFLTAKRAENVSIKTLKLYKYHLTRFAEFAQARNISLLENINSLLVSEYISSLKDVWQPGTRHIAFRAIRTFTYWYEDFTDGEYHSPCHKLRAPKLPKNKKPTVDLETFRQLLSGCEGKTRHRDKALLMFAFDSAMRMNEIRELNIKDVNLMSGRIEILHGKGDKYGVTYISSPTLKALRAYLKTRRKISESDPLFTTFFEQRISVNGLTSILSRIQKRAGIDVHGFHAFRRGFGTEFIRNGGDLSTLQKIYRHADVSTTVTYLGLTDDDVQRAHNASAPILRL